MPFRRRGRAALRSRVVTTTAVTALPALPALVVGRVSHSRLGPVRHSFRHRAYQWLVDLDALPDPPRYLRPCARFSTANDLGEPCGSIKPTIEAFLARPGV